MNPSTQPTTVLDFRGTPCPYNYVKTKLHLEELPLGSVIAVQVDAGEPQHHVPRSLERDGQTVHSSQPSEDGSVQLIIEKTCEY